MYAANSLHRRAKEGRQNLIAPVAHDGDKLDAAPSAVLLQQPNGRPVVAAPASPALRKGVPELGRIIHPLTIHA
jgi:hypothetical protein